MAEDFNRVPPLSRAQHLIRMRLQRLLGWHTREEDTPLSDRDFIDAVYRRWRTHQGLPLIDPNE